MFFFFARTFLAAVRSLQTLRIPVGSEWEPAWLRSTNQPEHFAQRRAICLPCLAGAAPHIAEQSGSDCVLLRAAQQCPPPLLPAGPASLAERREPAGREPAAGHGLGHNILRPSALQFHRPGRLDAGARGEGVLDICPFFSALL